MSQPSIAGRLFDLLPETVQRVVRNRIQGTAPLTLGLLYTGSGLKSRGWFKSRKQGMPVNQNGDPIPWMTYAMISFLNRRLNSSYRLFEYGSGNSTKWFAARANEVISVEHSSDWADLIRDELPPNVELMHRAEEKSYVEEISDHGEFDIVIVDGRWRNNCLEYAENYLTDSGVLILDDADRDDYRSKVEELESRGYNSIRFTGMSPINRMETETMIFYRDDNVFDI